MIKAELTKDRIGADKLQMCAEMLRSIAHPQRMEIIRLLHDNKELNVSSLQEKLNLPQPAVSTHLKSLKDRGILNAKREGSSVWYSLKYPNIIDVVNCVESCAHKIDR